MTQHQELAQNQNLHTTCLEPLLGQQTVYRHGLTFHAHRVSRDRACQHGHLTAYIVLLRYTSLFPQPPRKGGIENAIITSCCIYFIADNHDHALPGFPGPHGASRASGASCLGRRVKGVSPRAAHSRAPALAFENPTTLRVNMHTSIYIHMYIHVYTRICALSVRLCMPTQCA